MGKIFHHTPPLDRFAFPGGYQLLYLVTDHRGQHYVACPDCATKAKHAAFLPENRGFLETPKSIDAFVNWEGPPETCEDCGEEFSSEYGEAKQAEEVEEDEEKECLGHPAGPCDPMSQTVYCDGSCR